MKIERIRERMLERGLSQAELARRVHVTQGAIQQIVSGATGRSRKLPEIARALDVSVPYLLGETDDPTATELVLEMSPETMADELGVSMIREVDVAYGMGEAFVDDFPEDELRPFDTRWLQTVTRSAPELLFVARGVGDSMMPTLMDSDTLLVDRGQRRIQQQDRVWALSYGEIGMVKRVRKLTGDRLLIMSDNPQVPDFEAPLEDVHPIGRVVWVGRKI